MIIFIGIIVITILFSIFYLKFFNKSYAKPQYTEDWLTIQVIKNNINLNFYRNNKTCVAGIVGCPVECNHQHINLDDCKKDEYSNNELKKIKEHLSKIDPREFD